MEHTKGPWAILRGYICTARPDGSVGLNSKVVAHIANGELSEANAIRIVAAVNACEGIEDAMLADRIAFSAPDSYLRGIESERDLLRSQKAELVEALERVDLLGNGVDSEGLTAYASLMRCGSVARAVLAKVK